MNKFKFHSVGQGLFYTGQLGYYYHHGYSEYCFVYDCGSESNVKYLNTAIDDFADRIDGGLNFCVISHLHKDHYSGLYRLNKLSKISKLILPYLPDFKNLKTVYIIGQYFENGLEEITDADIQNLKLMLGLYGVFDRDETFGSVEIEKFGEPDEVHKYDKFQCFKKVGTHKHWCFEFYNKAITDEKWSALDKKLEEYLTNNNIENLDSLLSSNSFKIIVAIYKEVFGGNLNATSIILKHYPMLKSSGCYPDCQMGDFLWEYLRPYNYHCGRHNKNITVLTGDAEFDVGLVKRVFSDYTSINVLQVPHHGSNGNWVKLKLPKDLECKLVVSFGLGNKHKHPDAKTVNDILSMQYSDLILVNQDNDYTYYIFDYNR